MAKKTSFFPTIFQKRYIELPILEVVLIGAPIKITYFFQVVLIRGISSKNRPKNLTNIWKQTVEKYRICF